MTGRTNSFFANLCLSFFFFQAEDGIRDYKVTGVQTCALPISRSAPVGDPGRLGAGPAAGLSVAGLDAARLSGRGCGRVRHAAAGVRVGVPPCADRKSVV